MLSLRVRYALLDADALFGAQDDVRILQMLFGAMLWIHHASYSIPQIPRSGYLRTPRTVSPEAEPA